MTKPHSRDISSPGDPASPGPGASGDAPLAVLLVEDDALVRMIAADMLRDLGHDVVETEYGPDALEVLEARPIDVMVTDVGLPGLSGIELAERARRLQPGLGLIFATGDTELESREGRNLGVVLCKPYDTTTLAECLRLARR
jgi:CheY-like chemotaxis protein